EAGGREAGGREAGGREAGGREAGGREAGGREAGGREAGGREAGGREAGGREAGGREAGGRGAGGREAGDRNVAREGNNQGHRLNPCLATDPIPEAVNERPASTAGRSLVIVVEQQDQHPVAAARGRLRSGSRMRFCVSGGPLVRRDGRRAPSGLLRPGRTRT